MPARPNILWFISDDTAPWQHGYNGGRVLSPTFDDLAALGVVLDRFSCAAPACTPSRYTYLTGKHAGRCPSVATEGDHSQPHNVFFNAHLDPRQEKSLGHYLQAAGYYTGHVGKWHVAGAPEEVAAIPQIPPQAEPREAAVQQQLEEQQAAICAMVRAAGFDEARSVIWGNHDKLPKACRQHNVEWTTQGALDFIEEAAAGDQPFFLSMATTTLHAPPHASSLLGDPYLTAAGYSDKHLGCQPSRASIYERLALSDEIPYNSVTAGVLWMDDALGAVLQRLEALGLRQDTVVIVSSDHGPSGGGKFTLYEAGLRIPFIIHWPGQIEGGRRLSALAQNTDLLPTLLEIAGAPIPDGLDGHSLLPVLRGEAETVRDETMAEFGYSRAIRTDRWKYIAWRPPREVLAAGAENERPVTIFGRPLPELNKQPLIVASLLRYPHYLAADQLYDLQSDPAEQHNLAADPACASILAEMRQRLDRQLKRFDRPFPLEQEPDWPAYWDDASQRYAKQLATGGDTCRRKMAFIGFPMPEEAAQKTPS